MTEADMNQLATAYESEDIASAIERGEFRGGPNPFAGVRSVTFTIRLDREVVAQLRESADAQGEGVTQLVRRWVVERLAADASSPARDPREMLSEAAREMDPAIARALLTMSARIGTFSGQPARRTSATKKTTAKKATAKKAPAKKAPAKKATAKKATAKRITALPSLTP